MKTINIPTSVIVNYRECNRETEIRTISWFHGCSLNKLEGSVKLEGFKEPLELAIIEGKAILFEGNHRLAVALRLNLQTVPVRIQKDEEIPLDLAMYLSDREFVTINEDLYKYL